MKQFYNSFTFILAFLIATLTINMTFGKKFTEYFLLLVLLSMIFLNSDKFANITKNLSNGATDKPFTGKGGDSGGAGATRKF